MTPEQIEALLAQAVAVARRGPTATPNAKDRDIVQAALPREKRTTPRARENRP